MTNSQDADVKKLDSSIVKISQPPTPIDDEKIAMEVQEGHKCKREKQKPAILDNQIAQALDRNKADDIFRDIMYANDTECKIDLEKRAGLFV